MKRNFTNKEESRKEKLTHRQTMMINRNLTSKIENWLQSNWTANNFEFGSFSEFLRRAFHAYKSNEIQIDTGMIKQGETKTVTITLDEELLAFYKTFPARHKRTLVEKILEKYYSLKTLT